MKLTNPQKELLFYLGGPEADDRVISLEVFSELEQLGLLYKREDGPWDLTDQGEEVYERLSSTGGW